MIAHALTSKRIAPVPDECRKLLVPAMRPIYDAWADSGMTIGELAKRAGLSRSTVWRYMHAEECPGLANACAIAGVFDLEMSARPRIPRVSQKGH